MEKFRQFGLIGYPLAHSFSQRFFTNKFEQERINARYDKFEIERVDQLLDVLKNNSDLVGLNVTIPHKQAVIPFLSDISDEAKAIGAINVIQVKTDSDGNHSLKGYNSDVYGFINSIRPLLDPAIHTQALVLGTGGASKAVVYGLNQLGVQTQLVSRKRSEHTIAYEDLDQAVMAEHKVVVNCTPLGTFPKVEEAADIPYHWLTTEHLLFDLVYNPEVTEFLKRGQQQGAIIKNGGEMLELQAIKAWEIWNQ